ncbi:MAG: sugar ABC transporter ATP-binding protein [Pirellulales bacterium]
MADVLLKMQNISKRFGPTIALDRVHLNVEAGQVLALIGENGAGKSTLLKILSGAHSADNGTIEVQGSHYMPSGNPNQSRRFGIAMIYQELNLAPDLSVEDNMMLGQPCLSGGWLLRGKQRTIVERSLAAVGLQSLSPRAIVGKLSVATQQLIEIARALTTDAKVILFDEPTSSLPRADVQRLFQIIKNLRSKGLGIVYISHFLEEIREVADRYCVLRDGRHVGEGELKAVADQQIISLMVGRDVKDLYPKIAHQPGDTILDITQLSGVRYPKNLSLKLRRGEIFGVAGLVGAGRTEFLRTLMGLDYQQSGKIATDNRWLGWTVRSRIRAGLGLLSEDRKREGLAQELSIAENITLSRLEAYSKAGFLSLARRNVEAERLMKLLEVKAHSCHQPISQLSGGNQQKVALARIIHQQSDVLLLDEPTKGIDVGTKSEIYRVMGQLAADGKTIVFVSSYLPELLAVCDRIGVMARGRLVEVRDASDWTDEQIMSVAVSADLITEPSLA